MAKQHRIPSNQDIFEQANDIILERLRRELYNQVNIWHDSVNHAQGAILGSLAYEAWSLGLLGEGIRQDLRDEYGEDAVVTGAVDDFFKSILGDAIPLFGVYSPMDLYYALDDLSPEQFAALEQNKNLYQILPQDEWEQIQAAAAKGVAVVGNWVGLSATEPGADRNQAFYEAAIGTVGDLAPILGGTLSTGLIYATRHGIRNQGYSEVPENDPGIADMDYLLQHADPHKTREELLYEQAWEFSTQTILKPGKVPDGEKGTQKKKAPPPPADDRGFYITDEEIRLAQQLELSPEAVIGPLSALNYEYYKALDPDFDIDAYTARIAAFESIHLDPHAPAEAKMAELLPAELLWDPHAPSQVKTAGPLYQSTRPDFTAGANAGAASPGLLWNPHTPAEVRFPTFPAGLTGAGPDLSQMPAGAADIDNSTTNHTYTINLTNGSGNTWELERMLENLMLRVQSNTQ